MRIIELERMSWLVLIFHDHTLESLVYWLQVQNYWIRLGHWFSQWLKVCFKLMISVSLTNAPTNRKKFFTNVCMKEHLMDDLGLHFVFKNHTLISIVSIISRLVSLWCGFFLFILISLNTKVQFNIYAKRVVKWIRFFFSFTYLILTEIF